VIPIASILGAVIGPLWGADPRDRYKAESGDLAAFILKSAAKFGVRILTTNDLPGIRAKWFYNEADNEFNVVVEGNYFPQLHAFLIKTVGPPTGPPRTNSPAKRENIEAFYGTNLRATVGCGWEKADDGKQYTSFTIVSYGGTPEAEAAYASAMAQARQQGEDYFSALDAARPSAPYLSDIVRLFPEAEVNYRYFGARGEPGFNVAVDLYERYQLKMRLPVRFDSSRRTVIGYGEPKFYLLEVAKQKGRETSYNPEGGREFGPAEWKKIVESRGDFGAIGYTMITNKPVPGFKDRKIANTP
jgi:hypothetical protein